MSPTMTIRIAHISDLHFGTVFAPSTAAVHVQGAVTTPIQSGIPISALPAEERVRVVESIRRQAGSLENLESAAAIALGGVSGSQY